MIELYYILSYIQLSLFNHFVNVVNSATASLRVNCAGDGLPALRRVCALFYYLSFLFVAVMRCIENVAQPPPWEICSQHFPSMEWVFV